MNKRKLGGLSAPAYLTYFGGVLDSNKNSIAGYFFANKPIRAFITAAKTTINALIIIALCSSENEMPSQFNNKTASHPQMPEARTRINL